MRQIKTIHDLIVSIEPDIRLVVEIKRKQLALIIDNEPSIFHKDIRSNANKSISTEVLLLLVKLSNDYTVEEYLVILESIDWDKYGQETKSV